MIGSRLPALLLAGAVLALGAPPPASAQDDDAAKKQAAALFRQGREFFEQARYPEALAAFEQANAIKPHPLMLYNIGQVYEAMGDLPRALDYYEQFLATGQGDGVEVRDRIARIKQTMAASWTTLDLTSEPAGANVWVGEKKGRPRGVTPLKLQLPAGTATIVLEKTGYRSVRRPVKLEAGRAATLAIVLPPMMPMASFRSTPPGASVSIDGAPAGVTPFVRALAPGRHTAVITLEGREPVTREIVVGPEHTADRPLVVDVAFEAAGPSGLLEVAVDREGAEIVVDGKVVGTAPLSEPLRLTPGAHRLEVRADGEDAHEETVIVNAGETTRTTIALGGEAGGGGVSRRTWGWILMGAGGAALAGGGVMAVIASGADGDLGACRDDPTCNGTGREVDLANDVRGKALMTDILFGAGVGLAAGGAVLYLLGDGETADTAGVAPRLGVVPAPGGVSASITGEF